MKKGLIILACSLISALMWVYVAIADADGKDKPEVKPKNVYISMDKCKLCHPANYKKWTESKMAKAFDSLNEEARKKPECLPCHTTGFGHGGYDLKKSIEENKKFEGVTCESCHGPGGNHLKAKKEDKKKNIILGDAVKCVSCHYIHKKTH